MTRTIITDAIREELNRLNKRTNIGPPRLLKGCKDRPKGLNSTIIYHWMSGKTTSATSAYLDWVLEAWRNTEPLEPFTETDIAKLNHELSRTGYAPQSLLRRLSPVPDGLTPKTLHQLRYGLLQKLPASQKAFLFEGLVGLPDR